VNSIRQRLLFWQIGALVITGVLVSALTYRLAWNGFNRIRDYGLEQIAYSVIRHGVKPRADAPALRPPPEADTGANASPLDTGMADAAARTQDTAEDLGRFVSQIWLPNGEVVYTSHERTGPPMQTAGFHVVPWDDELWRIYTVIDGGQVVQVAVTSSDRSSSFSEMAPWLMVPLAVLVLLLGLLIHTAVARALQPLERLGHDIGERDVNELHAVSTDHLPDELAPLANALNQLLARVDKLLSGQRRFVADAAHELNTPLAAVKLQAQLARRASDAHRTAALDELDQGIERATHLVAQLLQMARIEPDVRQRRPDTVRLDSLCARVVAAFSAQAEARQIDLGLDSSDQVAVFADPAELRAMLDNLVDNALRHTPPGSRVDVRVRRLGDSVELEVCDNGPGIPESERARVLQRFIRLNPQDATGSGLGLSIVAQIVENKGGRLTLGASPEGGLVVRVTLAALPAGEDAPAV
jgi:two-component system, OmpR family, sensor kinase